jgi:hypothetical protein
LHAHPPDSPTRRSSPKALGLPFRQTQGPELVEGRWFLHRFACHAQNPVCSYQEPPTESGQGRAAPRDDALSTCRGDDVGAKKMPCSRRYAAPFRATLKISLVRINKMLPDAETRKRWWLLCYGITSMQKATSTASILLSSCDSNLHPLFLPLAVATHAFYARPFKMSKGAGVIEKEFIPPESTGIHAWLIDFRDGAYSHTDALPRKEAERPLNDVVYEINNGIPHIATYSPSAQIEDYGKALRHFAAMEALFALEIASFHKRHLDFIPRGTGHYKLSLDPLENIFIPYPTGGSSTVVRYG